MDAQVPPRRVIGGFGDAYVAPDATEPLLCAICGRGIGGRSFSVEESGRMTHDACAAATATRS